VEKLLDKRDFSDRGWLVLESIRGFYDTDTKAAGCDKELLIADLSRRYPKHAELLAAVVTRLEDVSAPNVVRDFVDMKRESLRQQLGTALLSGEASEELLEEYKKYSAPDYDPERDNGTSVFVGMPVEDLMAHFTKENLIRVFPQALNEQLDGGVPAGTHLLAYARPETGKTAFCVTNACGFAYDGRKVLYIGNEDPYQMMLMRIISRLTQMTRQQIQADMGKAYRLAMDRGYENIALASMAGGGFREVRYLIEKYNPDVVVLDQLHNMRASKNLTKVEKLEHLANEAREVGKYYNKVIMSVTQAGESAANKDVLDMEDVYFSNVAIQQAVDVMIGIGASEASKMANVRFLSLCKNKISGKHDAVQVNIAPDISRIY
jgi:archaellum biogenesis ATPase FlaH